MEGALRQDEAENSWNCLARLVALHLGSSSGHKAISGGGSSSGGAPAAGQGTSQRGRQDLARRESDAATEAGEEDGRRDKAKEKDEGEEEEEEVGLTDEEGGQDMYSLLGLKAPPQKRRPAPKGKAKAEGGRKRRRVAAEAGEAGQAQQQGAEGGEEGVAGELARGRGARGRGRAGGRGRRGGRVGGGRGGGGEALGGRDAVTALEDGQLRNREGPGGWQSA